MPTRYPRQNRETRYVELFVRKYVRILFYNFPSSFILSLPSWHRQNKSLHPILHTTELGLRRLMTFLRSNSKTMAKQDFLGRCLFITLPCLAFESQSLKMLNSSSSGTNGNFICRWPSQNTFYKKTSTTLNLKFLIVSLRTHIYLLN